MPVDKKCKDVPYLLGRLYAIIEVSAKGLLGQFSANDYGLAMRTPGYIFPQLYTRYLGTPDRLMEDEAREIMSMLPQDQPFPMQVGLAGQGQFLVGYELQMGELFKMENRRKIATAVKVKRTKLDMTQQQLAEKAGITANTVGNIESGDNNVSVDVLSAVMAVLGLKIEID